MLAVRDEAYILQTRQVNRISGAQRGWRVGMEVAGVRGFGVRGFGMFGQWDCSRYSLHINWLKG